MTHEDFKLFPLNYSSKTFFRDMEMKKIFLVYNICSKKIGLNDALK